ncbi:hypothetical protein O0544_21190 [Edwardsiella anguillarum]|nr:hypothetical protein [Edwardsiella anguillarum]
MRQDSDQGDSQWGMMETPYLGTRRQGGGITPEMRGGDYCETSLPK